MLVAQSQRNVTEVDILSLMENMSQQLSNGTEARGAATLRGGHAVALKIADQTPLSNSSPDKSASNVAKAISLFQEDEKSLLSHAKAVSNDAQASWTKAVRPTLPRAPSGHHWVIQDTSDTEHSPLLSEYVPDSHDTYVDLPGSPWKLVKSSKAASLVVQLIGMDAWKRQLDEKIRKDKVLFRLPFSTRKIQPPPWLASVAAASGFFEKKAAKPLNATAATGRAALEVAEESPFLLQHVMPIVFLVRDIPLWLAQRLKKMAAKVTEMGLVTAQIVCSTVMLGVLLVFIIIDKGLQVCRGTNCDETNGALQGEEYWRQQLTSWEAMPGVEYNEIMGDG